MTILRNYIKNQLQIKMKLIHNALVVFVIICLFSTFGFYYYSSIQIPNTHDQEYQRLANVQQDAVVELQIILSNMENRDDMMSVRVKLLRLLKLLRYDTTDTLTFEDENPSTELPNSTPVEVNHAEFNDSSSTDDSYSESQTVYACAETFRHAKYGHPLFINGSWVVENCTNPPPIHEVLSVVYVVDDSPKCSKDVNKTFWDIRKNYPDLPIFVGEDENSHCYFDASNITTVIKFQNKTKLSKKLNTLVNDVKTPLVLIARNLDHFNWLARLERQLSVYSTEPEPDIIGGSVRNNTGHWHTGCYQSDLQFYILKYTEGYHTSQSECMYCDYLSGPFIAKKELLLANKFDEKLDDEVLFQDFFLRVKNTEKVVMTCPDAMYHATDPGIETRLVKRETWIPLTKKWNINRIVLDGGVVYKYSCSESNVHCNGLAWKVGAKMMPVCCRDALLNGFKTFHEFSLKHGINYQIEGGSALGAVKFSDVIPWDFDGDGSYYEEKKDLFKKELNWTNSEGEIIVDHIKFKADGFFYVSTPHAFIEFWAVQNLSVDGFDEELRTFFKEKPTLMRIGDAWVYATPSPGLYTRNYYGRELLRHSNSYYHLGRGHWYHPYNVSDPFLKCAVRHHACLDQFENDGSVQFKIP